MKVSTLHNSFTLGNPYRSINQMVLAAFEGRADALLAPSDVITWYEGEHGALPYDPASVRGAMSSMAKNRRGKLVKTEHGTYGLAAVQALVPQLPTVANGGGSKARRRPDHAERPRHRPRPRQRRALPPDHLPRAPAPAHDRRQHPALPRRLPAANALPRRRRLHGPVHPRRPPHPLRARGRVRGRRALRDLARRGRERRSEAGQLGGKKSVTLVSDNPQVQPRTLWPTEDPEEWRDAGGETIRMVIRGRVLFPFDTGPAVFGQLAEFARSLMRS